MAQLLALVAFSFVCSVTPGPNNVLLWASGAAFGFRRTIPHVLGTAVGLGGMALGAAAGIAAVVAALPVLAIAMKVAGSLYLLVLALNIARSSGVAMGVVAGPLTLRAAAAFQVVNPKAWIFALGAVTTFRLADLPPVAGAALVAVTMMAVIVPSAAIWAVGGGAMGRLLTGDRAGRAVAVLLGLAVAATVALVWI